MPTIKVTDVLNEKILVGRESARRLKEPLTAIMGGGADAEKATGVISLTVDFGGIEGIAPSFLDELLTVFESVVGTEMNGQEQSLIVAKPPTRLSLKFEAIARGHRMSIRPLPDGSWVLTKGRETGA